MSASRSTVRTVVVTVAVLVLLLVPLVGTDFFVNFVMTRTLILGLAASSIVFLSSYVGMVSLAQYLLVGVAGFTSATASPSRARGSSSGWTRGSPSSSPSSSPRSWRSSSARSPAERPASTS